MPLSLEKEKIKWELLYLKMLSIINHCYKHIQSETVDDYKQLFEFVKEKGFEVIGVILDGEKRLK